MNSTLHRAAGLIACGTIVFTLTSCGPAGESPTARDTLIYAKAKDAVKLDPADITDGESAAVTVNIFDGLVQFKKGSTEVEPALATSWQTTPDGKTWTFKLRPGVKFHDGTPCDAQAVKFSFDRQNDKKSPHRYKSQFVYWTQFFNHVKAIEAPSADTIVFKLAHRDAMFLANMALFTNGIVSPKAIQDAKEDLFKTPVGTGPFKFVAWTPNEKIVLEANPDYWGGAPKIKRLIFKPIPDNSVRLMELTNGTVHVIDGINPDDVDKIRGNGKLVFLAEPGMNVGYLALNMDHKPLDNPKVRQAIAHAINKQSLVRSFFAGGTIGRAEKNPMPPVIWGYNDGVKDYAYDPPRAKQLLKEAGMEKGFSMSLWAMPIARPYMPEGQKIAQAIMSDLKAVGITANIVTYEWGTYLQRASNGEHDAVLLGWIGDNGDPDNFLYTLLDKNSAVKGSASNYSFYKSDEVDKLLIQARELIDQKERAKIYMKIQEIAHRDAPMVPLFNAKQIAAVRSNVKGFALHPVGSKLFKDVELVI